MIGVEIDPELVMTSFTQSMIGFFYLVAILSILTVGAVWFWKYWKSRV